MRQTNKRVIWARTCIFYENLFEPLVMEVRAEIIIKGAKAIVSTIRIFINLSSIPRDLFFLSDIRANMIFRTINLMIRSPYISRKSKLLMRGFDENPNFLNQAKPSIYSGIFSEDSSCDDIQNAFSEISNVLIIHSEKLPLSYKRLSMIS